MTQKPLLNSTKSADLTVVETDRVFDLEATLRSALSESCEITSEESTLKQYSQGTESFERRIQLVVKPNDQADVGRLLLCANHHKQEFAIHPISTGKNWGYGSANPPTDAQPIVLLDLSLLNKITLIRSLDLVTVEPGVTQQQLFDFITKHKLDYLVPTTGAGPDASILANALERGYGITPYTQHFDAVTDVKGYWGSGEVYRSALTDLDGTSKDRVNKAFKYSPGPYLDGLFTQSNLGIATEMTIRLVRKKEAFASFFLRVYDEKKFSVAVEKVQSILRNYEGIVGSINFMDKRRMISMFAPNPNGYDKHAVMSDDQIQSLTKELDFPEWTAVGTIYGSASVVAAVKKDITAQLKPLKSSLVFSNSRRVAFAKKVWPLLPKKLCKKSKLFSRVTLQLGALQSITNIMLGEPNRVALTLAYWRNPEYPALREKPSHTLNPANDGCGLLWYAPLVPLRGSELSAFTEFVREVCPRYRIDPLITFTLLRHDCLDSTVPIVFNARDPLAVADAHACLNELTEIGLARGWVPYRLNIDQQQWMLDPQAPFWRTVRAVKDALDPNYVISPGRYCP